MVHLCTTDAVWLQVCIYHQMASLPCPASGWLSKGLLEVTDPCVLNQPVS